MINATSAADIAFIMSSSTSAWLPSPLECSPQKQNGWTLRFCFWGWIMSINWGKRCIIKQLLNSVFAWNHELSKLNYNTDLGFDNSWSISFSISSNNCLVKGVNTENVSWEILIKLWKRVKDKDIFNNQCNLSILFFFILTNFRVFLLAPVTRNSVLGRESIASRFVKDSEDDFLATNEAVVPQIATKFSLSVFTGGQKKCTWKIPETLYCLLKCKQISFY